MDDPIQEMTPEWFGNIDHQQKGNIMNQKQHVKAAILSAINAGLSGQAMIDQAVETVFNGLVDRVIPFGKITPETTLEQAIKEARFYAGPVVKNYLKKDPDLNGGVKYVPDTRRGPRQSTELKELHLVLTSLQGREGCDEMVANVTRLIELQTKEAEKKPTLLTLEEIQAKLAKYGV